MTIDNRITLFYSPQTRAKGICVVLEELGVENVVDSCVSSGYSAVFAVSEG